MKNIMILIIIIVVVLKEWLETSNKALLVTDARQIGKTWLIRDEIDKSGYKRFEVSRNENQQ